MTQENDILSTISFENNEDNNKKEAQSDTLDNDILNSIKVEETIKEEIKVEENSDILKEMEENSKLREFVEEIKEENNEKVKNEVIQSNIVKKSNIFVS
jgi:hypothetical protein